MKDSIYERRKELKTSTGSSLCANKSGWWELAGEVLCHCTPMLSWIISTHSSLTEGNFFFKMFINSCFKLTISLKTHKKELINHARNLRLSSQQSEESKYQPTMISCWISGFDSIANWSLSILWFFFHTLILFILRIISSFLRPLIWITQF